MSEATKTLPALFAVILGIALALITGNPIGFLLFLVIAFAQYHQRNEALHPLFKLMFVAGAGLGGALTLMSLQVGVPRLTLLCALTCAFCTSSLYTRMKV